MQIQAALFEVRLFCLRRTRTLGGWGGRATKVARATESVSKSKILPNTFQMQTSISRKSTHAVAPAIENRAAPRHRVRFSPPT